MDCSREQSTPIDPKSASTSTGNKEIPVSTNDHTDQLEVTEEAVSNTLTMKSSTKSNKPRFGDSGQAKERLKFILGASEDNSSDDEPLVLGQATKVQPESTETPKPVPTMPSDVPSPLNPSTCLR